MYRRATLDSTTTVIEVDSLTTENRIKELTQSINKLNNVKVICPECGIKQLDAQVLQMSEEKIRLRKYTNTWVRKK